MFSYTIQAEGVRLKNKGVKYISHCVKVCNHSQTVGLILTRTSCHKVEQNINRDISYECDNECTETKNVETLQLDNHTIILFIKIIKKPSIDGTKNI